MVILGKLLFAIAFGTVCTCVAVGLYYCLGWLGWRLAKFGVWLIEGPRWARFAVVSAIIGLWTFAAMVLP